MNRFFITLCLAIACVAGYAQNDEPVVGDDYMTPLIEVIEAGSNEYMLLYADSVLAMSPNNSTALAARGMAHAAAGLIAEAVQYFTDAIKHWNKACYFSLGALYDMRGNAYTDNEEYDLALADYDTAIRKDKDNASCYEVRADHYYHMHNYRKSLADWRAARSIDPGNEDYKMGEARCLYMLGEKEQMVQLLDEIIAQNPKNAEALERRATMYRLEDDYKNFLNYYAEYMGLVHKGDIDLFCKISRNELPYTIAKTTEMIDKAESKWDRFYWHGIRARVYIANWQYEKALEDLGVMSQMAGYKNFDAFVAYQKSLCYLALSQYDKSEWFIKQLLAYYDGKYQVSELTSEYNILARSQLGLGKFDEAKETFGIVIDYDATLAPSAYVNRAYIYELQHNYDAAMRDYNSAIEEDETISYLYMARGRLSLRHMNDTASAYRDFEHVLEIDTVPYASCRQYALAGLGRAEEAMAWNERILTENSDVDMGDYYDAACLYAILGKNNEAMRYLTRSFKEGYRNFRHAETDEDLKNLWKRKDFKALLLKYRSERVEKVFGVLKRVKF